MKQAFRILALLFACVVVLAIPAFAVSGYVFNYSGVQFLPAFNQDLDNPQIFYLYDLLPEGRYEVFLIDNGYVHSLALVDILFVYDPVYESDAFTQLLDFSSGSISLSYRLSVVLVPDENMTCCVLEILNEGWSVSEGTSILFVPVESSDSNYLRDFLVDLFGPYEPQMESVTEILSDGSSVTYERVIPDVAGLDYEWLASVGLFALVVFCFFRIVGGALKQ